MIPNYIIFLINNLQLTMYNYFQLSIVSGFRAIVR